MSAMIYDTTEHAFVEAEIPMKFDTGNQSWADTIGLAYNPEVEAWEEKWGSKQLYLVKKDVGATKIGTWSGYTYLDCVSPYVQAHRELCWQPLITCSEININLGLYHTLYIDFQMTKYGQSLDSGALPFTFYDSNGNILGTWQFNSKPTGTMTVDISSVTGVAKKFSASGSGTFYGDNIPVTDNIIRINELWLE